VVLGLGRPALEAGAARGRSQNVHLLVRFRTAHEILQAAHAISHIALEALHLAFESSGAHLAAHAEQFLHTIDHYV